jgi:hypothetical protein
MSRQTISLKSRVRYEGLGMIIDRRSDLEVLPNPIWYTVGHVLRRNYRNVLRSRSKTKPKP